LPRDEVARAINSEVKAGRGSPHGGVFLDIASRRPADEIKRRLPSMYHQFKQLADVDITTDPMEVGPTCHYANGGIRVDADTEATTVAGLYSAGEVAGGMHGANRLGGNSLSDLLVFGRRAGLAAAEHALGLPGKPVPDEAKVAEITGYALGFFANEGGENPYAVHQALQETMQDLVGIIRTASELDEAKDKLVELAERAKKVSVEGNVSFNPGWHMALDLESMLACANCTTLGAIERKESRGGHTREDFPKPDPELEKVNMVTRIREGAFTVTPEPKPVMPDELAKLFEEAS
jgi:succinate dehydrogenase / fumarate reductase flavoprotein subunit